MVSMDEMATLVKGFKGTTDEKLPTKHIPGPEGVRGRNSDNTLIKQVLGWAPQTTLKEGNTMESLTQSKVVSQAMTDKCDMGSKAAAAASAEGSVIPRPISHRVGR